MLKTQLRGFTLLLIGLMLVSCASTADMRVYTGLAVTGVTVDSAAEQMQAVNALYVERCKAKTLTAKQCNDFIAFGTQFKEVYPHSVALWKSARRVSNAALQKQTDVIITTILSELVQFGVTVGYSVIFKSEGGTPWLSLDS